MPYDARRWRLAMPRRRLSGRIGDRLGRGVGASIEFEDHRAYQPGDDPRHVDWRAFARTDRLQIRVFREEVAPVLDVVVDTSASMATTPDKAAVARALCSAAAIWARLDGGRARFAAAGGPPLADPEAVRFSGRDGELAPRAQLWPAGLRLVISDFLLRREVAQGLRHLAIGASHLFVVQLLAREELAPEPAGAVTLEDVEDGGEIDLVLDARAIARYQRRLSRLTADVSDAVRAVGGSFARVAADAPDRVFEELARQGVLEPA